MRMPSDRIRLFINIGTVVALLLLALWADRAHHVLLGHIWLLIAAAQTLSMVWQRFGTRVK